MAEMEECRTPDARPGRRWGRVSALFAALLAVCAALPAAASAQQWGQPFDLSQPGKITPDPGATFEGIVKPPDVGLDDNGNATFVWMHVNTTQSQSCAGGGCGQVKVVRRSASGVLGNVTTLSPPDALAVDPQLQVAANGDAMVAWEQGGRIAARFRRATTGAWGPLRYISGQISVGRRSFTMDMNAHGDAEFAWRPSSNAPRLGPVFVRSWSHTGSLGPQTRVGVGEQESPQVAMFANGDAIVAWSARDGETCPTQPRTQPCIQLYARPISADSVLGQTEAISPPDQRVVPDTQRLAADGAGDMLFAWRQASQSDCPFFHYRCSRVLVRARSAAGELSDRQIASQGSAILPDDLQVALDGDGSAVVGWLERHQVQFAERSATGDLKPVQTIATGQDAWALEFQLAPDGHGLFTWLAGDGDTRGCPTYDVGCERMQTMERAPDGSLGPIETLSPGGQDAISSRIALAPNGAAAAIWGVGDLGYPPQPPALEYVQGAFRAAPGSP